MCVLCAPVEFDHIHAREVGVLELLESRFYDRFGRRVGFFFHEFFDSLPGAFAELDVHCAMVAASRGIFAVESLDLLSEILRELFAAAEAPGFVVAASTFSSREDLFRCVRPNGRFEQPNGGFDSVVDGVIRPVFDQLFDSLARSLAELDVHAIMVAGLGETPVTARLPRGSRACPKDRSLPGRGSWRRERDGAGGSGMVSFAYSS